MRVQSIGNQPSFAANAHFTPPAVPINLRTLITSEKFLSGMKIIAQATPGGMKETDLLKELNIREPLNVEIVIENLQLAARKGGIKRSSEVIVPPKYYTEAKVFKLNGDTLVLYTKPDFYDGSVGSLSKIEIEHAEGGLNKGTTHIFREYYNDPEFDSMAKALNELPE